MTPVDIFEHGFKLSIIVDVLFGFSNTSIIQINFDQKVVAEQARVLFVTYMVKRAVPKLLVMNKN